MSDVHPYRGEFVNRPVFAYILIYTLLSDMVFPGEWFVFGSVSGSLFLTPCAGLAWAVGPRKPSEGPNSAGCQKARCMFGS